MRPAFAWGELPLFDRESLSRYQKKIYLKFLDEMKAFGVREQIIFLDLLQGSCDGLLFSGCISLHLLSHSLFHHIFNNRKANSSIVTD